MIKFTRKINSFFNTPYSPYIILGTIIIGLYYKLFFFGRIPFPGDLLVGSYYPWLDYFKLPVQNPLISDVFSTIILWKYLSIDILKSGQWPLWNPYSFNGTPLLATFQSATLYPLNLFLLLPKYFGWGVFIFSQTLIASIGMYLLLSVWLSSKLARLTGAIIFALGGLMTTWLEIGIAVHAIIWLPYSLFFIERYLNNFKLRYLLFISISLVFSTLAGHAQMTIFSLIIILIFAFIRCWDKNVKLFFIHFFPITLSLAFSLVICSIQLLPSLDLLNKSIRLTESYTEEFNYGLLPLKDLLKFFIADFFGNPVSGNYSGFLNYFETSGFLGNLTLPLLIFSLFYLRKTRLTILFSLILLFSILLSFSNPLSQMVYQTKIPLLTSSYASRMLFITLFSAATLSAFSINQILTFQNQTQNFFKATIWGWSILVGILIGSIVSYQIIRISTILVSVRNSVIPVLIISIFLISLILLKRKQKVIFTILFVLMSFDLGRYFLKFNTFVPQELIFPTVPAIQFLQKQPGQFRIGREHAEVLPPNTWMAYNLQSLEGYDPLYLNQYAKLINFLNGADLRTSSSSRYAEITQNYSSSYIDAANVRYFIGILKNKKSGFDKTGYKRIFQDKSAVIFENPKALDRVYFAASFRIASNTEIEQIMMTDSKFDPRKEALLSKSLSLNSITGQGKAVISNYSANIVKIKTDTLSEELLILADQYEEGWQAKIDGKEVEVNPANLIFRAIRVPSGQHEVLFYYYPRSFYRGLKISLAALLLISFASLLVVIKKLF